MARVTAAAPRVSEEILRKVLHEHWQINGDVTFKHLNSECDLNLLATISNKSPAMHMEGKENESSTRKLLIKISNSTEDPSVIDMQNKIMAHLESTSPNVLTSRLLKKLSSSIVHCDCNKSAEQTVDYANGTTRQVFGCKDAKCKFSYRLDVVPSDSLLVKGEGGELHFCRVLSFIEGKMFALASPHSNELLFALGQMLGQVDVALQSFDHAAAHRTLRWDLQHSLWAEESVQLLADDEMHRGLVKGNLQHFKDLLPRVQTLRRSIIHNDANDYNIVIQGSPFEERKLGLIDWGDVVHSCTIFDLAIGLTYALLDKKDPIAAAVPIVAGYHSVVPLTEEEVTLLPSLVITRLSVSVTNSAVQRRENPTNEYLSISERPAWCLLHQLRSLSSSLFIYALRGAIGLDPVPTWGVVTSHLSSLTPALLCGVDFRKEPFAVLDSSISSLSLGTVDEILDVEVAEYKLFKKIKKANAKVGVGRWDEVRPIYMADAYKREGNHGPEWRTVHIGIDLFMAAFTPLFAPIEGRVHSVKNNAAEQDYGPTIILEHSTPQGVPFYTLYGHLAPDVLQLRVGDVIRQGAEFCRIGNYPTNGNWPPHVHFQIILDLLGMHGDFPGVAFPSQRSLWKSLCPNASLLLPGIGAASTPAPARLLSSLLDDRRSHMGKNLSIAYNKPLHIVRGHGAYLYDEEGRAYLDAVNNVAHVGHTHPRIIKAAAEHMSLLNTNTRYLSEVPLHLAARLRALLPSQLSVCYFVCSGSEANDLALRIAAAHTKKKGVLVIDAAYHGHTAALIDVSPYKHNGPGGQGTPPHVAVAPLPDVYRGSHRGPDAAAKYVNDAVNLVKTLASSSHGLSAFIHESVLSCGGQIPLPPQYLAPLYEQVRSLGGVCIADEVQTGFGRPGSHFWAFQTQSVVPDIVTLGKPMGNGHPIAAVICTPELARSFANGMEYFNTFGGNPVSCAVALEVLQVIEEEKLQERAKEVGGYLHGLLCALQQRYPIIGDVRGVGFFIGIELVFDPITRKPAAQVATYIVNRMRELGVLLSPDGPHHNVLKIKPPLVWRRIHADFFVAALERVLREDACNV